MERGVELAPPRHFPRRSNPLTVGIHSQTDEKLQLERWTPALFRAALDGLGKGTQIQTPY
jgi:hypothetical protein